MAQKMNVHNTYWGEDEPKQGRVKNIDHYCKSRGLLSLCKVTPNGGYEPQIRLSGLKMGWINNRPIRGGNFYYYPVVGVKETKAPKLYSQMHCNVVCSYLLKF